CCRPFGAGEEVRPVKLDALLRVAAHQGKGRVRLIKIDTEGAEYPAFFAAELLGLVDEIIGEWHNCPGLFFDLPEGGRVEARRERLFELLRDWGFDLHWEEYTPENGHFWATRPAIAPATCCP